jgi:hypothetical protein
LGEVGHDRALVSIEVQVQRALLGDLLTGVFAWERPPATYHITIWGLDLHYIGA